MATSSSSDLEQPLTGDEHTHYSHRAPWLHAFVVNANDGLLSVSMLMLGMGAGSESLKAMQLSGLAGLVVGALCIACMEYMFVSSQRDTELADIEKEREDQVTGPAARKAELEELTAISVSRGLSEDLAKQVAMEPTEKDIIRAHARDELGIDVDELANPIQASLASAFAFSSGAALPLLGGACIADPKTRNIVVAAASAVGLAAFTGLGAYLGGAYNRVGPIRVLLGGWIAMAMAFGCGMAFSDAFWAEYVGRAGYMGIIMTRESISWSTGSAWQAAIGKGESR